MFSQSDYKGFVIYEKGIYCLVEMAMDEFSISKKNVSGTGARFSRAPINVICAVQSDFAVIHA